MGCRRRDAKRTWWRVYRRWGFPMCREVPSSPFALWAPGCLLGALLLWLERLVLWPPGASSGYSPPCPLVSTNVSAASSAGLSTRSPSGCPVGMEEGGLGGDAGIHGWQCSHPRLLLSWAQLGDTLRVLSWSYPPSPRSRHFPPGDVRFGADLITCDL